MSPVEVLRLAEGSTSYTAKGREIAPADVFKEEGSSRSPGIREVVPELSGRRELETYHKMANSNAAVDVSLRAAKTPVQGASFQMDPASDEQIDRDIAEFCSDNIFGIKHSPWLLSLGHILEMCENGFSIIEPIWETREWAPKRSMANRRKYTTIRKLAPRPAINVVDILYDNAGGPEGIKYANIDADNKRKEVEIEIAKLVIFTLNQKGGNLRGKSFLRTAYPHWYFAKHLYNIDGIQKERHALGVPHVKLPPGYSKQDAAAGWELVRNLRTNEKAGMVTPPGYEVTFAKLEGQPVDVMRSVDHHNGMIMLNVMLQFLIFGVTETGAGSRATAGSHQNMFEKSLKYLANLICEYFNLFLIPRLVYYNFDTDRCPRMTVRNIGEAKDLQMWASAVSNLISQNAITVDLETEQWVREQIDAPKKLGDKQTPENNSNDRKGGVDTDSEQSGSGNVGKGTSEA